MDIKLPIKIHNRFDIEVKDITTGEILQIAKAENIILNNFFSTSDLFNSGWTQIAVGSGTGTLNPARTTLFQPEATLTANIYEFLFNQPPLACVGTKVARILPNELVGKTFTEVGIGSTSAIYTHALIKDSEGNTIALGPKKDTQEITIYRTVYCQFDYPQGITFLGTPSSNLAGGESPAIPIALTLMYDTYAQNTNINNGPSFYTNNTTAISDLATISGTNNAKTSVKKRAETSMNNGKIKTIGWRGPTGAIRANQMLLIDLETLAENTHALWSGWEFDKTPVGVGNGSQIIFNLTWDEVWLAKPKKVYIDSVEVTTGFTFNAGNITFDNAPVDGAVITADYWVKYAPKDINHVFDIQIILECVEGGPI